MLQININPQSIYDFPEKEWDNLQKLLDVFNYHIGNNDKKQKYYEGSVSVNDVNLGIALPEVLRKLEIGCAWGAKCVDVLAGHSVFDGFVGTSGNSVAELEKYFRDPEARKCVPSAYAKEHGVWQTEEVSLDGKGCSSWWLRSPGSSQKHAALVFTDGNILLNGTRVNSGNYAVRPAMWISLV